MALKKLPNILSQNFRYESFAFASKNNFYKTRFRTNIGKQRTKKYGN